MHTMKRSVMKLQNKYRNGIKYKTPQLFLKFCNNWGGKTFVHWLTLIFFENQTSIMPAETERIT